MISYQQDTYKQLGPGPGIPTLRFHAGEVRRIGQLIGRGQFRTGWHRTQSLLANVWNFQVRRHAIKARCPCCGWEGPGFISLSNWRAVQHNSRCPGCDSRSRHRGLARLLPELLRAKPEGPVLVFAPEPSLLGLIARHVNDTVKTTDYRRTDVDYPREDIQQLTFADNSFAFLTCNHVLEHIPDDRQALRECARVLKPGGVAVFTIPGDYHKQETWYLDKADVDGHLRHYGMDVLDKMHASFNQVETVDMSAGADPYWHIYPGDTAFICRK
ncbi:methyltransferase domain-containing protein [Promineifilum sp.]|uniref:methyltransferase domain-containing protein n=1 Tax=Promineifilum sp. TaxID=2664178 RepID=UPI0035AEF303